CRPVVSDGRAGGARRPGSGTASGAWATGRRSGTASGAWATGRRPVVLGERQLEDERRACAGLRANVEAAAHPVHELSRDIEAEPRPARPRELRPGSVELVEDPRLLSGGQPGHRVLNRQADDPVRRIDADGDRAPAAVLDRVVEQIDEDLLDAVRVPGGADDVPPDLELERDGRR